MLGEALDGAALSRRVTPLEEDHGASAGVFEPVLELQQLHLQPVLLDLVLVAIHALGVGIALLPRVDRIPLGIDQVRVGCVPVRDGVAALAEVLDVLAQALGPQVFHDSGSCQRVVANGLTTSCRPAERVGGAP